MPTPHITYRIRAALRRVSLPALVLGLGFAATTALACAFDLVKPEKTMIDWIVQADDIVLARADSENPFVYTVTDVMVGDADGASIAHLVDSATRRRLSSAPNDAVLFTRDASEDWRRVVYVGPTVRPVVEAVLKHRANWAQDYHPARQALIEGLQGSIDPTVQSLVIAELDKMPYDMLRQTDLRISTPDLLADMWTLQGYPFQAVRALLLGLNGDDAARAELHAYIDRVSDWEWSNNLGAFSAALIEIDGVAGVRKLADTMLTDQGQALDKLDQVLLAFAVQNAVADDDVKAAIANAVADAVAVRPELAARVAHQFSAQSDWSQARALAPLLREQLLSNEQDLITVTAYMIHARHGGAPVRFRPKRSE